MSFTNGSQIFFNNASIREEIKLIEKDANCIKLNIKSTEKTIQPKFNSVTYKLWFNEYFHPFNNENLVHKLSERKLKEIAEMILQPINEGIDFHSKEPFNKKDSKQYSGLDANEKFSELFRSCKDIFQLSKGFEHVKKNITSDQVKQFFSLYADICLKYCFWLLLHPLSSD